MYNTFISWASSLHMSEKYELEDELLKAIA